MTVWRPPCSRHASRRTSILASKSSDTSSMQKFVLGWTVRSGEMASQIVVSRTLAMLTCGAFPMSGEFESRSSDLTKIGSSVRVILAADDDAFNTMKKLQCLTVIGSIRLGTQHGIRLWRTDSSWLSGNECSLRQHRAGKRVGKEAYLRSM